MCREQGVFNRSFLCKEEEQKKKDLETANKYDDREIKDLEKKLGLKKRKNKSSLPQGFINDGLGCILSYCNAMLGSAIVCLNHCALLYCGKQARWCVRFRHTIYS